MGTTMRTKLDHPVMHNGEVTTIAELDARGLIHWRMSDKFHSQRGTGIRAAYFADIKGTTSGWEVSKYAYEGRVSKQLTVSLDTELCGWGRGDIGPNPED